MIALLSDIILQGPKAAASSFRSDPGYQALLRHGYIRESGVVSSVPCLDCADPHDAEIVCDGDCYGYFCSERGFVPVAEADILGVTADMPEIIDRLVDSFACTRRKSTPIRGRIWRIGAVATAQGDAMLWFCPRLLGETEALDLADAFSRDVRTTWRLIVTAEGRLPVPGAVTIPLTELVDLDPQSGRLTAIADPREIIGIPVRRTGGAPNRHGAAVQKMIDARHRRGAALPGMNEEARAIMSELRAAHPGEAPPALPTVKRYLTKARAGS